MQKISHSAFKSRLMLLLRILFTCKLKWIISAKFKKFQPPYSQDIFPIAQSSISVRGGSMVSKSVDLKEVLSGISWHYWVQTAHCAEYIVHLSNIHISSSSLHNGAKKNFYKAVFEFLNIFPRNFLNLYSIKKMRLQKCSWNCQSVTYNNSYATS